MFWLRQSTSVTVAFGPGLDITDGVTPETSLATAMDNASTGIRVSKNGGNLIDRNSGTAPVHDEVGWYGVNLSTADTDTLGALQILFSGATVNLPIWMEFMIVPANVWDSLFGADVLQTDVTQWLGTAAATPTVAGVPEVDVTHMAGGVQTVTDLKDFADAGYDPGTNKIQGVVLVDTTTDNSDMRGTDSAALASVATEARLAELDAANLPTDVAAIPTTAMRGTDSAALASEVTSARMGVLTDWIDGNRLDLLLDAIPTTAMRGTDSAALASVATEARLAELDAANLPTDIAAIPTTAMRGTDSAALASVATEARLAELDAGNLPTDIAAIPTTAMRGTDSAATAASVAALNDVAATDIVSAGAITTLTGAVVNVDSVDTIALAGRVLVAGQVWANDITTWEGVTDSAAYAINNSDNQSAAAVSALTTAQADLDKLTGSDGATLATAQANYAPATAASVAALNDVAATDIVSAGAITTLSGAVVNVDLVDTITTYTGNTLQTGDTFALANGATGFTAIDTVVDTILADTADMQPKLGTPDADIAADVAAVKVDTGNLATRITSTLFTGITSLAEWLGLMAGNQVANSTALTEVKASGAGSGTYDESTDSLEAIAGAGGGGAPTVAQIRTEMDSNSTQLAAIVADTGELQTDWANTGRLDTILDTAASGGSAPTAAAIRTEIDSNSTQLAAIVEDTGTTIPGTITTLQATADAIPTTAMRGTDSAALASVATEARLAELDAANLPTDIAAIPTTAMRGTDSAALASVATEARLAELDAANIPADIDAIPTTAMRGTDNSATASVLGAAVGASISADIAEVKAETALVVADTNELQADDYPTLIAAVQTVVDAIKTVTDLLPSSGALTDLPVNLTKVLGTALAETTGGRIAANLNTFWDNADAGTSQTVDDVGSGGGTVDANVTQFLGTTIVETSAGNIAANFDEFYDNDDAITIQNVDNVGAGAGGSATGAKQDKIIALLGSEALVQTNILSGGTIVLKQNDDHTIAADNEITIIQSDAGSALFDKMSVAGTTMQVGFRRKKGGAVNDIAGTLVIGDVSHAADVTTMLVEVPAANTLNKVIGEYNYDIQLTTVGGDISTELTGPAALTQDNAT
jgi:hypothetical protein